MSSQDIERKGKCSWNGLKQWMRINKTGYLFMLPFLGLFFIFTVIPVFVAFGLSFTHFNMLQPAEWVGLLNYKRLIMDDEIFLLSLQNTFVFAFIMGPLGFILSFLMAWVINSLKCRNAFALAFYAPSITSGVAMSVIWLYFFAGDRYGLINHLLITLGVITKPILWTMDVRTIMPVVIFVSAWMSMGTGFLVFLAGFQTIPRDIMEAGKIDGIQNKWQELAYIIFPAMKPQCLFSAINAIVGAFGVFDIAVAMAGMPSPNYAAHTIVAHLYDYAFIRFDMGYASAVATVLFFITFVLGRISMKIFASHEDQERKKTSKPFLHRRIRGSRVIGHT